MYRTQKDIAKLEEWAMAGMAAHALCSWQATPLMDAAWGAMLVLVAQILAPRPSCDAPGAIVSHICTAAAHRGFTWSVL